MWQKHTNQQLCGTLSAIMDLQPTCGCNQLDQAGSEDHCATNWPQWSWDERPFSLAVKRLQQCPVLGFIATKIMAPEGKASGKTLGSCWRARDVMETWPPHSIRGQAGDRPAHRKEGKVRSCAQVAPEARHFLVARNSASFENIIQWTATSKELCLSTAMLSHAGCRKCRSLPHFLVLFKVYSQSIYIISYIYIYIIYNIYIYIYFLSPVVFYSPVT